MDGFNFTNEEIVYIYKHLEDYTSVIKNNLLKQLSFTQGQLELSEKVYGKDENFDREEHELQLKLVRDELPKAINERLEFITRIKDKFEDAYELISDVDPDFISGISSKYFNDSAPVRDIIDQIKNKHNDDKD